MAIHDMSWRRRRERIPGARPVRPNPDLDRRIVNGPRTAGPEKAADLIRTRALSKG